MQIDKIISLKTKQIEYKSNKDITKKSSVWAPFPGPQTSLINSDADEVFFGGAAGGGKVRR